MDPSRGGGTDDHRTIPAPMPEQEAIARALRHVAAVHGDVAPSADRFGVGWTVFVPLRPARVAVVYVGDDGVVETASSTVGPAAFAEDFERRFRLRHRFAR